MESKDILFSINEELTFNNVTQTDSGPLFSIGNNPDRSISYRQLCALFFDKNGQVYATTLKMKEGSRVFPLRMAPQEFINMTKEKVFKVIFSEKLYALTDLGAERAFQDFGNNIQLCIHQLVQEINANEAAISADYNKSVMYILEEI